MGVPEEWLPRFRLSAEAIQNPAYRPAGKIFLGEAIHAAIMQGMLAPSRDMLSSMNKDDDDAGGSAVCFAHLLIDGQPVDPQTWKDVAVFRKAERARLYTARKQMSPDDRKDMAMLISVRLTEILGDVSGRTIAVYWPIRGELNLRPWMVQACEQGARVCLPVVVAKDQPVEFHRWTPDCAMAKGTWNIPVPADPEPVEPDVVVVPLLGVDDNGYRLGNGGGYYDRTLARLPDVLAIGVGQPFARMKTVFPMPWDVPMNMVVLGDGTVLDIR